MQDGAVGLAAHIRSWVADFQAEHTHGWQTHPDPIVGGKHVGKIDMACIACQISEVEFGIYGGRICWSS
jgi:hypothetical protein